jgi:hypothetical protein
MTGSAVRPVGRRPTGVARAPRTAATTSPRRITPDVHGPDVSPHEVTDAQGGLENGASGGAGVEGGEHTREPSRHTGR